MPKDVKLNTTQLFIKQIPRRRELINHLSDIDFKYFTELVRKYTKALFPFLFGMLFFFQIMPYVFERL